LLEDLHWASNPPKGAGLTKEQLVNAVTQLAQFHAEWWKNPRLERQFNWIPKINDFAFVSHLSKAFRQAWEGYQCLMQKLLKKDVFALVEQLSNELPSVMDQLAEMTLTVCHNDLWTNNLFVPNLGDTNHPSHQVYFLDWQCITLGPGASDLALLLYTAINSELRQSMEQEIMKLYHLTLAIHGVRYSFEHLSKDYEVCKLYALARNFLYRGTPLFLKDVPGNLEQHQLPIKWQEVIEHCNSIKPFQHSPQKTKPNKIQE